MSGVVFDTTILIDHLRNYKAAVDLVKKVGDGLMAGSVSMLTVAELFSGKDASDSMRREKLRRLLDLFEKIPIDEVVAERAGLIKMENGIPVTDSIIAATALASNTTLYTSNLKDFKGIPGLDVKAPY